MVEGVRHVRHDGLHNNKQFLQFHSQLSQLVDHPPISTEGERSAGSEKRRFYFHDCRNLLSSARAAITITPAPDLFNPEELEEIKRVREIASELMTRMSREQTDCLAQNIIDTRAIQPFFNSELFSKHQKNSPYLNFPEMRKIAAYIPTALQLNEAYMEMIRFFIFPSEHGLKRLQKGAIRGVDIFKKATPEPKSEKKENIDGIDLTPRIVVENGMVGYEWEPGAEQAVFNYADALIYYSIINKFAYKDGSLSRVVMKQDGSVEFIASKNYGKNLRLDRYAEGMVREKPTRKQLVGDDPEFSQGLYAAELLGYATGKEIVYRIQKDGIVSLIVQPTISK